MNLLDGEKVVIEFRKLLELLSKKRKAENLTY